VTSQFWLNFPNMITLGRIICVPVLVWLVLIHNLSAAFWVFLIAGISDGLDGLSAKLLKAESRIGAYLDPIADKLLLVSSFIVLGAQDLLPLWLVVMVVFRDGAILIGAGLIELLTHNLKIAPNLSSKLNTVIQIMLVAYVFAISGLMLNFPAILMDGLIYLTGLTTLLSGIVYFYQWGSLMSQSNGD
jgi:cardiolipin synthase